MPIQYALILPTSFKSGFPSLMLAFRNKKSIQQFMQEDLEVNFREYSIITKPVQELRCMGAREMLESDDFLDWISSESSWETPFCLDEVVYGTRPT